MEKRKIVIYQVLTRLFGNQNQTRLPHGNIQQNGCGKMNDFTPQALQKIAQFGATHIWYTGIIEHATQTVYNSIQADHPAVVKGKAGSPYAIKDYYDIDPDLAVNITQRMQEFEELVQRTHQENLKVIIDFVPNHVARQYHSDAQPKGTTALGEKDNAELSFSPYNNFYYLPNTSLSLNWQSTQEGEKYLEYPAKATGNNQFSATPSINDWYETIKLNYGIDYFNSAFAHFNPIPDTWQKMRDILLFWASKKVDAFRCDMAEMVPVEFWSWVIPEVKKQYPELLFIAEVYDPNQYHRFIEEGQFDFLYDKVGLYDTLKDIIQGKTPASAITNCWQNLNGLEKKMLNFLENHDEQRIASDFFATCPEKAIPAMTVATCMNTNPIMIYFGQELGEKGMDEEGFSGKDGRTTIFDYWGIKSLQEWLYKAHYNEKLLPSSTRKIYHFYQQLLNLCGQEAALYEGLFFDLMYANLNHDCFDAHQTYVFLRKHKNELLLVIAHFGEDEKEIAINIPPHAFEYLGLCPQTSYKATDLLTDKIETISLLPYKTTKTRIKGWSSKLLKLTF